MKRYIMILITALMCCSCVLDYGSRSRYTADDFKGYASYSFNRYVLNVADRINILLMLDDYLNASEEERLGDSYKYVRDGLVRTSENVYHLYYSGEIDTGGKSFRDISGNWKCEDFTYKTVTADTWEVTSIGYLPVEATVKVTGLTESGTYIFEVTSKVKDEAGIFATDSWSSQPPVSAVLSTDGPVVLKETFVEDGDYRTIKTLNADGRYLIDISKEGTSIDWVTMEFTSEGGMAVIYKTSLD